MCGNRQYTQDRVIYCLDFRHIVLLRSRHTQRCNVAIISITFLAGWKYLLLPQITFLLVCPGETPAPWMGKATPVAKWSRLSEKKAMRDGGFRYPDC